MSTRSLAETFRDKPLNMLRESRERNVSLSSYLETLSPKNDDRDLDAFQRLLREEGLRTSSDLSHRYSASPVVEFLEGNNPHRKLLLIEVLNRAYRQVSMRAPMVSNDMEAGATLRPFVDGSPRFDKMVAPVVPLSELISTTTQIQGQDYRTLIFEYDKRAFTEERVPEGDPLPLARLTQSENVIPLFKRGIRFSITYEFMRRSQVHVDKLALQIQKIAVHRELAKVKLATKTMIEGDGNPDTAAQIHGLYELDPRADGFPGTGYIAADETVTEAGSKVQLTVKSWLAFKKKFANPYTVTTILMNESMATNLELLDLGTSNTQMIEIQNLNQRLTYGQLRPINATADGIRYGWLDSVPDHQILAFDNRFAVEHIVEIGGDINEMDRFIHNQTEEIAISENYGMAIMDQEVCRILDARPSEFVSDLDDDTEAEGGRGTGSDVRSRTGTRPA